MEGKYNLKKKILFDIIFSMLFSIVWLLLFWKCFYGFGEIDESFYLTIPLRLIHGDSLLCTEWHVSQLSSFILYPIMKIYMLIFHSTEGIILHFRFIFTALWGIFALFIFIKLKKYSQIASMIASISFLIYTPFGIMALSYNSIGIMTLLGSGLFMIVNCPKSRNLQYVFAGIMFAFNVLCCPYTVVIYVIFTVAACISYLIHIKILEHFDFWKIWAFFSLGCFIVALSFIIFVLSRTSVLQIIEILPDILDDPEHANNGFFYKTSLYFKSIHNVYSFFGFGFVVIICFIIISKRHTHLEYYCFIIVCLLTVNLITVVFSNYYFHLNPMMFSINIMGFYCYLLNRNSVIVRKLFYYLFVPGLIYSFCLNYSSNQQIYAISSAMAVSSIASIMIISIHVKKFNKRKNFYFSVVAVTAVFSTQLLLTGYLRYNLIFWDSCIQTQKQLIEFGPEKGLLVSEEKMQRYKSAYDDANPVFENKDDNVLFFSSKTWLYLCQDFSHISTYSAWLSDSGVSSMERLEKYYNIFPEKQPDIIYVDYNDDYLNGNRYNDKYDNYIDNYKKNRNYSVDTTLLNNYIIYRKKN